MFVDSHAHVNFRSFKDDAKETIQRALDGDVWVVNVGSQIDTSRYAVEVANQYNQGVYAVVGLHPEHTYSQFVDEEETHFRSREEVFDYELYRKLAQDPKVVGIGECGLDYYRLPEDADHEAIKQKQKDAFRAQVKLAKELNKALVIHSRPAKDDESLYDDLLAILDDELSLTLPLEKGEDAPQLSPEQVRSIPSFQKRGQGELRFEVHSFTGSPQSLQKFLDRGAYVSFNGIITFDKTGNMEKLVQMVPLEQILLETDCPYLTPVPHRGKRNEPAYVIFVAEKFAQLKNASLEEVAERATENTRKLFKI